MSRYKYVGEAEQVCPSTCEGPRVIEAGDVICLPDTERTLDGHPLFKRLRGACPHTVAGLSSPGEDEQHDEQHDEDPNPGPDEPTA